MVLVKGRSLGAEPWTSSVLMCRMRLGSPFSTLMHNYIDWIMKLLHSLSEMQGIGLDFWFEGDIYFALCSCSVCSAIWKRKLIKKVLKLSPRSKMMKWVQMEWLQCVFPKFIYNDISFLTPTDEVEHHLTLRHYLCSLFVYYFSDLGCAHDNWFYAAVYCGPLGDFVIVHWTAFIHTV